MKMCVLKCVDLFPSIGLSIAHLLYFIIDSYQELTKRVVIVLKDKGKKYCIRRIEK